MNPNKSSLLRSSFRPAWPLYALGVSGNVRLCLTPHPRQLASCLVPLAAKLRQRRRACMTGTVGRGMSHGPGSGHVGCAQDELTPGADKEDNVGPPLSKGFEAPRRCACYAMHMPASNTPWWPFGLLESSQRLRLCAWTTAGFKLTSCSQRPWISGCRKARVPMVCQAAD